MDEKHSASETRSEAQGVFKFKIQRTHPSSSTDGVHENLRIIKEEPLVDGAADTTLEPVRLAENDGFSIQEAVQENLHANITINLVPTIKKEDEEESKDKLLNLLNSCSKVENDVFSTEPDCGDSVDDLSEGYEKHSNFIAPSTHEFGGASNNRKLDRFASASLQGRNVQKYCTNQIQMMSPHVRLVDLFPDEVRKLGKAHTSKSPCSCKYCDKERKDFSGDCSSKEQPKMHARGRHYICNDCSASFSIKSDLKKHIKVHIGGRPFSCHHCIASFNHKVSLKNHIKIHTVGKPCSCNQCSRHSVLMNHMRLHTDEKPYKCAERTSSFRLKTSLKTHIRVHTGDKPFCCKLCPASFSRGGHLKTHIRVHTGEKPFSCNQCSTSFGHKSSLLQHMRVHTGKKPFSCKLCSASFSFSGHLKRHLRVHSGEKPFSCNQCSASFGRKSSLNTHIRVHTGEKPFRCNQCSTSFSLKHHLKRHSRIHSG